MTLSRATIEGKIYDAIISAGSNTNVIFMYPNAPRPPFPYTAINFREIGPQINPWKLFNRTTNLVEYYEARPMRYTISCYSDDMLQAQDETSRLQGSLIKDSIRYALQQETPISINVMTDIQNNTLLIDESYESRSMFDIIFSVGIEDGSTTEDLGYFDQVGDIDWSNY